MPSLAPNCATLPLPQYAFSPVGGPAASAGSVDQTRRAETKQKKRKFLGSALFTAGTGREDREGSGGMFQFSFIIYRTPLSIERIYRTPRACACNHRGDSTVCWVDWMIARAGSVKLPG